MSYRCHEDEVLDGLEDERNPRMIIRVLETVEWLAKRQIANNVECCKVEPADHVDLLRSIATVLLQSIHQLVDVAANDGLLLQHYLMREPMGQTPSIPRMVLAIRANDVVDMWDSADWVFAMLGLSRLAVAAHVVESIWVVE